MKLYDDNLHPTQSTANERFRQFFKQMGLTNVIYGLMRTEAVRQTNVFGDGSLPVADIGFMAELLLRGQFVEIPQVLFYRRRHPGAFSSGHSDVEAKRFFWQADKSPFRLPIIRQNVLYVRSILSAKSPIGGKLNLRTFVSRRLFWQQQRIAAGFLAIFRSS